MTLPRHPRLSPMTFPPLPIFIYKGSYRHAAVKSRRRARRTGTPSYRRTFLAPSPELVGKSSVAVATELLNRLPSHKASVIADDLRSSQRLGRMECGRVI